MAHEGGGYFRGLVTGVLVGAATALLLAPKRGEDIRQDLADSAERLKEKAGDLSEHLSETAQDLKERGTHLVENARERGSGLIAQTEDTAQEWDNETQSAGDVQDKSDAGKEDQAHDVVESV